MHGAAGDIQKAVANHGATGTGDGMRAKIRNTATLDR
jgi:hypothetical protein